MSDRQRGQTGKWIMPALLVLSGALALPSRSLAEAENHLALAEQAYGRVDFEGALSHATEALAQGHRSRQELTRIYELQALCAAVLGHADDARRSYARVLALNPEARVDQNLAPHIRAVFLEARGNWVASRGRLSAEAAFVRSRGTLRFDLADTLGMARTVSIWSRPDDSAEFTEESQTASSRLYISVPGSRQTGQVEFYVRLFDEYGNQLLSMGSEDEPRTLRGEEPPPPSVVAQAGAQTAPSAVVRPLTSRPWFWVVIGSVALVVAGGAVAAGLLLSEDSQAIGGETDITIGLR